MKKIGFTLAEVLITLGIIGVVAAMTLPTLIQKNNERAVISQLKKAYSALSQSYLLAINENGAPEYWDLGENENNKAEMIYKMIGKGFKVIKDCEFSAGCFADNYKAINGAPYGSFSPKYYTFVISDGTVFGINTSGANDASTGNIAQIIIDVNGKKNPNKVGEDLFYFLLRKNNVIPAGTVSVYGEDYFRENCLTSNGYACTAWLIYNENMDYLHCKDLSWSGKTKCK